MRVIKAVLFVAVLVCCLTSAFAQCNAANSIQSADGTGCICASGYQGATCNDPQIGSCSSPVLSKTEATNFPSLSATVGDTAFVGNVLKARVEAVYVQNRQYNELEFTPLNNNAKKVECGLGNSGSYWFQNRTLATCNDSFILNLPWNKHTDCGFANNTAMSNADYMYITGYLHIKYTDWLGEVDSFNLTRTTKVPYSITVKFQKHVTVTLKPLNVTSDVKFGMALTEDLYDPVSSQLTLQLTTIVNWPNVFYSGTTGQNEGVKLYTPDQVQQLWLADNAHVNSDPNGARGSVISICTAQTNGCPDPLDNGLHTYPHVESGCLLQEPGSTCKQSWTWVAMIDPVASGMTASNQPKNCSFDGEYQFEVTLYTCRHSAGPQTAPSCTFTTLNITYTIQDSYVCGVLDITPAVTGKLYAFPPTINSGFRALIGTSDITHFSLGTSGNFYAKIDSDGNDISIVFTDIKFKETTSATWTDLLVAGDEQHKSGYLSLNHTAKYFNIYFHSSTFKVQPNSQTVYTFSATATVSFKGNPGYNALTTEGKKKRVVEMEWTQAAAQATTNVFMAGPASEQQQQVAPSTSAGVSSVTFIASVVGAVAGTMIIVFVVVGLALRARSTKEDGMSASLMAASAAASEVTNRA